MKNKEKIVSVLRSMIDGKIGLINGCRIISKIKLMDEGSLDNYDEDINVFRSVDSETDHFPLGGARGNCNSEYLNKIDNEMSCYLSKISDSILMSCNSLLSKLESEITTKTKSAEILDKNWLMCPDCVDAWESISKEPIVICPKCNNALRNPRCEIN